MSEANIRSDIKAYDKAARYLVIKGAFNINSTSKDAWTMLLGNALSDWEYQGGTEPNLDDVFFRFPHGAQQLSKPVDGSTSISDMDALEGAGRQVNATNAIQNLAQKIVDQIQSWTTSNNKPFDSLKEFINSGVIEGAITTQGINSSISADLRNTAGALTQADVVASMAQFITARSDTFLVRAYGDVRNPITEEIISRAWCEATVQRVPDLTKPTSGSYSTDNELNPPASYKFGRQFKIISFRWLTTDEI